MSDVVLDLETNTTHDRIWIAGIYYPEDDKYCEATRPLNYTHIRPGDRVIMHNGIDFDEPMLKKLWGYEFPEGVEVVDTLVMSRLWCPTLQGGHSLEAWGERLNFPKGDFTDYDAPAEGETVQEWQDRMSKYCEQDVRLTWALYEHLMSNLRKDRFTRTSFDLEHATQYVVSGQVRNGFYFDIDKAKEVYSEISNRFNELLGELQEEFPPIITERYSSKQKDADGNWKRLKDTVEVFNPGSRPQIGKRLQARGVRFTQFTETGQPKVDNDILEAITHPAAASIREYLMLEKRMGQFDQWFTYYNDADGRIHGKVNSMGAATYRMSQFKPNLAQVPSCDKPYGTECRSLFCAPPGKVILGADASSLELRCFANQTGDEEYGKIVTEGDVHQYHADLLGVDRRTAKTFIYAFLYGAGNSKLGSIVGGNGGDARTLFQERVPGLQRLKDRVEAEARNGYVTGLDGRRVRTKQVYSALNYKLQSDGALIMKQACVNCHRAIQEASWNDVPMQVVAAHDEWQFEVVPDDAELLGVMAVQAIEKAGRDFNMCVGLTGEYMVGQSWAETH